ncbi:hypothetical protein BY458DRAFT_490102 [Sporodiniella umbellata]|nr:hypothetical protein BY458DRAFT_490102 [Sporodiniella umbellata]
MNFEDIVDMEWLDSHSTGPCLASEGDIFIKTEQDEPMVSTFDCYQQQQNQQQQQQQHQQVLMIPSIDQIKQLIELAKKQLALREELTPEPDSLPPTDTVLPDTVSPQSLVKPEKPTGRRRSESREDERASLETMAETDGIDIKNLSSKERRQLRNKISARNFRVRRKEYITALESQVDDHKKENEKIQYRLTKAEEENKQLKQQIESLKRQNQLLQPSLQKSNINKDISLLGSKNASTYFQDISILVS